MKSRIKPVLVITLILFFIVSCTKGQISEKAKWNGEIEYEESVKIVKNPAEPVYGEILIELEEELSIGREDDENYLFFGPRKIDVDEQGNIYILERGNYRIQKFDRDGQYLQTIGKEGQGPGEFERPYTFFLDRNGDIYVSDRRKIHYFKSDGEFVQTTGLSDLVTNLYVAPDGNIYGLVSRFQENENNRCVVKMDPQGKLIKYLAQFSDIKPVRRKSEGANMAFSLSHEYTPALYLTYSTNDKLLYGHSSEYGLYLINLEDNVELKILKEETLHSISQREKDKILEGFSELREQWPKGVVEEATHFPPHRPFYSRVLIDDKERIYVRRISSVLDEREKVEFDVFSKDGYYLYEINLPFSPEIIKNGCIYDLFTSEETGEVQIKRYKVINWNQIAEDI